MMKLTSAVAAVVVTSLASFWLAGCAGDASSEPGDNQEGTVGTEAPSTNGTPSGASTTLHPSDPPAATNAIHTESNPQASRGNQGGRGGGSKIATIKDLSGESFNTAGDDGCSKDGEVMCSCGVCAGILSCIQLCEQQVSQQ